MRVWVWLIMLMVYVQAESRVALLIGNSSYSEKRLENPGNDVDLLARKLKELDFTVITKKNLNKSETSKALKKFYRQIDQDTIALIYFSGHGVHSTIDNKNYLIPIGAFDTLINEEDLSNEAISDGKLLASTSGAKFSILLLDACRSNDFAKIRGDKGLGQPQSRLNNDYVISYATEVGKTAKDGNGNSPYALALVEYLSKDYSIGDIFTKVRAKVSRSTGGKQKPYYAPHFESILYLSEVGEIQKQQSIATETKTKKHSSKNIITIGNLMWQDEPYTEAEKQAYAKQKSTGKVRNWSAAKAYCKSLKLGEYADWRLPSKNELFSLYKQKNKLDHSISNGYWSSTPNSKYSSYAWGVYFNGGSDGHNYKKRNYYVRCVRTVQ